MPSVLRANGLVIYIYLNDHEPMHVHVFAGSSTGPMVIINLTDLAMRENRMNASQARRALALVVANREFLISEWKRIDPKL